MRKVQIVTFDARTQFWICRPLTKMNTMQMCSVVHVGKTSHEVADLNVLRIDIIFKNCSENRRW